MVAGFLFYKLFCSKAVIAAVFLNKFFVYDSRRKVLIQIAKSEVSKCHAVGILVFSDGFCKKQLLLPLLWQILAIVDIKCFLGADERLMQEFYMVHVVISLLAHGVLKQLGTCKRHEAQLIRFEERAISPEREVTLPDPQTILVVVQKECVRNLQDGKHAKRVHWAPVICHCGGCVNSMLLSGQCKGDRFLAHGRLLFKQVHFVGLNLRLLTNLQQ